MGLHILIHLQSTWPSQTPVDRCLQPHRPSRHWRGGDPGPQGVRVRYAVGRTDMRKGKNGLALQFQERLQCPDGLAELQKIFWGAGRTDVIQARRRWRTQPEPLPRFKRNRKFADSPLEEGLERTQSSKAKFPASWENTGNFVRLGPECAYWLANSGPNSMAYDPNSLRIGTGNLFRPSSELNRAIREFICQIRESRAGRHFHRDVNPRPSTRAR